MQAQETPHHTVATRLVAAIRFFARSEVGSESEIDVRRNPSAFARCQRPHVANSYVNRNLMSAIAERHFGDFVRQAEFTLAVFAASTIVAVLARFAEERLGLLWREFMTDRAVATYMAERNLLSPGGVGRTREPGSADRRRRARLYGDHAFLRAHGDE